MVAEKVAKVAIVVGSKVAARDTARAMAKVKAATLLTTGMNGMKTILMRPTTKAKEAAAALADAKAKARAKASAPSKDQKAKAKEKDSEGKEKDQARIPLSLPRQQ